MKAQLLLILLLISSQLYGQIEYGNNQAAGKNHDVGDAKIYYEIYGSGTPLILLHGAIYGYIDDYFDHIPTLQQHFKVIAIATRGHGKSEIGNKDFTEKLLADDVISILNKESVDRAIVLGFSAGAATAYNLAAHYPDRIIAVAALGGTINRDMQSSEVKEEIQNYSWDKIVTGAPGLFAERQKLMPEPERASEWINKLKAMWTTNVLTSEEARKITCPVLVIGGDRVAHSTLEAFFDTYRTIPNAQLSIIPNAGLTDLLFDQKTMETVVMPFILNFN